MSTYKNMEPVLQIINQNFISLDCQEVRENNALLKKVLYKMTHAMKLLDPNIFAKMYRNEFSGGSYYDNLKVGRPNEFDIDIRLIFPKCVKCATGWRSCQCIKLVESNKPGFLWLKVESGCLSPVMEKKWVVDGYVSTLEVQKWMKSLVCRAFNNIVSTLDYNIRMSESGPAMTLGIGTKYGWIDIDLVPCFVFNEDKWPASFRSNTTSRDEFFIVPKSPPVFGFLESSSSRQRYWRPSFQEQERSLITSKEKLKPALRLLKKTRTNLMQNHVASYYLKTIVLWKADSYDVNTTLSDAFMKLLKDYRDALKNKNIKYYWKPNNNLLAYSKDTTVANHYNAIDRIIKKIDRDYKIDPCVVAHLILTPDEFKQFFKIYERWCARLPEGIASHGTASQSDQGQSGSGWRATLATAAVLLGGAAVIGSILGSFGIRNNNRN